MDWDLIEGNWQQFHSKVNEKWGKLTDDDLVAINGRDQLEDKIQDRYGYDKDQARKEIDDWYNGLPIEIFLPNAKSCFSIPSGMGHQQTKPARARTSGLKRQAVVGSRDFR